MSSESVESSRGSVETVDVVVVGARCAGSATAIPLARRGRRVVVLDRASFPSDTMSTHLFFPHHWAEIEKLGALPRVRALGAPAHTEAALSSDQTLVQGRFNPVEGIAHGSCVRRPGLDMALVQTTREAGAEVRERVRVTDLVRRADGRVVGVRYRDAEGRGGQIRASLVVGADGRASRVAKLVEAATHHHCDNQRLMAFAYYRDPSTSERHVAAQWRHGSELGTIFPCDGGLSLVLLMSPLGRRGEFRDNAEQTFEATVAAIPGLTARLTGCERDSPVRVSMKHPSYFKHSHGPGWALAGDSGHFKDPVIAQGIRDALRFGRILGESASSVLDSEPELDRVLAGWEERRDRECLDTYQWGNTLGLPDEVSALEEESYRWFAHRVDGPSEVFDVFARQRRPDKVFSLARAARWAIAAARNPDVRRGELARTLRRDAEREIARRRERLTFARDRAATPTVGTPTPTAEATTSAHTTPSLDADHSRQATSADRTATDGPTTAMNPLAPLVVNTDPPR